MSKCWTFNILVPHKVTVKMGPKFSICIPVISNKYIEECLTYIFRNKFQDFEVIINDSSKGYYVSDIISKYDVKIIKKNTKRFESRMISALASSGERILMLDDTRLVSDNLLQKLDIMSEDIIAIGEKDIGSGLLIRLSNLDKKAAVINKKLNPLKNKSVIPRLYKRDIIVGSLNKIKASLNPETLNNIVGLDLEIIYFEAFRISQSIGYIPSPEILHYGDETLKSVFLKYYRYGFTQKMLRETVYSQLADISGRTRYGYAIGDRILSMPLQAIRGFPFILGYISGNNIVAEDTSTK